MVITRGRGIGGRGIAGQEGRGDDDDDEEEEG